MRFFLLLLSFVVTASFSGVSFAGKGKTKMNGKERIKFAEWNEYLAGKESAIPNMNKACGTKIKFTIDKAMFKPFTSARRSATSLCNNIASRLKKFCENKKVAKVYMPTIKKMTKVTCTVNTDKAKNAFSRKGGEVIAKIGVDVSDTPKDFESWLDNNLID